jgi:hypothetical protein
MSSKFFHIIAFSFFWLTSFSVFGQVQKSQIVVGTPTEYVLRVPGQAESGLCNVQISIDGTEISQQEVKAPDYEAKFILNPPKEGPINIRWEGKTKYRGLKTVSACSGSGVLREIVVASFDLIKARWIQLFAKLNPDQIECVKSGLETLRLPFESTNPLAQLIGPEAPEVRVVYEKCDQFIAKRLRTAYDCMVGSVPTKCSEQYYEDVAGRRSLLTRQEALIAHFEGRTLKTVGLEVDSARQARLKQEEIRREKEAAALAAKREQEAADKAAALAAKQAEEERERAVQREKEAAEQAAKQAKEERERALQLEKEAAEQAAKQAKEEHERRFKSDPNYRRQIEEAEKRRIAEQRALEAKAEREKQAAAKLEREAAAKAELEKQAAAKLEREAALKAEREKLEIAKREAELEKQKAVLSDVDGLDKKYGTAAVLQCGSGADDYLRKIAKFDFAWDEDTKGFFGVKFHAILKEVDSPGVLVYVSNKAKLQNGFGAFKRIKLFCKFDTRKGKVVEFQVID